MATVDPLDRYSILRHYNRGISNEFMGKQKDILLNASKRGETLFGILEQSDKRMEKREQERRKEFDKSTESMNASLKRIEEFDRKYKEKQRFIDKVYMWFLAIVIGVPSVYLIGKWISKPSVSIINPIPNNIDVGVSSWNFFPILRGMKEYGRLTIIGLILLSIIPYILPLLTGMISLYVRRLINSYSSGYKKIMKIVKEKDKNKDSIKVEDKENRDKEGDKGTKKETKLETLIS